MYVLQYRIRTVVFSLFYWPIKSLFILGMKFVFKYQDLQMFGLKLNKSESDPELIV